jgi:four helix bundle protein
MEPTVSRDQFNARLRDRTMVMALDVHRQFRTRKVIYLNRPLVNQLIRSSSSVAANTRAATRARSDAEFYSKICIVVEECDETQFWLDFLCGAEVLSHQEIKEIKAEVDELVRLFTAIKKKMKTKINGKI